MTIIYQYRVASTSLGGFLKLLRAWKGSVYKLLYKELIIFITLYSVISLVYRLALTADQKRFFEGIVLELHRSTSAIPLSFLLGFYVTFIVQRWWTQFTNVPWPDRTLFTMTAYLHGCDERARMMRRAVARYMLFGLIWICRGISVAVMKRFPTLDHIVEAGFITKEEKTIFEDTECKYQKFFVPITWANQILVTARREQKIDTDFGLRMILQPLADFRDKCSQCFIYDWITVPLVYTQVVTFAVYSYFAVSLFGQQYLDPSKKYKGFEHDFYFPGFSILQFLFYMGWLKVAEQMINPFGEDDDDFDINWLLDRHTTVAFILVDRIYGSHPDFVKDGFWNDKTPDVPYTESSARSIRPNFVGSTFNIAPPIQDGERMLIPNFETVNQHEWTPRHRSKGSLADSLQAAFHIQHLRQHSGGGSQTTLGSNGSGHGPYTSNGKLYYHMDSSDGRTRRSSLDIPVRERANTDSDIIGRDLRERKLSLPFTIHLFSRNRQKRSEQSPTVDSSKVSRFTVEPVKEEESLGTDPSMGNKTRRPGHSGIPFQNVVSRIPVLSAIEEGSTITSIKQLMGASTSNKRIDDDDNDDGDDNQDSAILSDDDKAYEDCISYVDEMSSSLNGQGPLTSSEFYDTNPVTTAPFSLLNIITADGAHKDTGYPDVTEMKVKPASGTKPTKESQKGGDAVSEQKMPLLSDGSPTQFLLPASKRKADLTVTKSHFQDEEELAPLILIEDC